MKKMKPIITNPIFLSLSIIIFFGILFSAFPLPWNDTIQNAFIDLQFKIRGSRQLSEDIVVVFIGNEDR